MLSWTIETLRKRRKSPEERSLSVPRPSFLKHYRLLSANHGLRMQKEKLFLRNSGDIQTKFPITEVVPQFLYDWPITLSIRWCCC